MSTPQDPYSERRTNGRLEHSNQIENRITRLEVKTEDHSRRLQLAERALQIVLAVLILIGSGKAHQYVPALSEILVQMMRGRS